MLRIFVLAAFAWSLLASGSGAACAADLVSADRAVNVFVPHDITDGETSAGFGPFDEAVSEFIVDPSPLPTFSYTAIASQTSDVTADVIVAAGEAFIDGAHGSGTCLCISGVAASDLDVVFDVTSPTAYSLSGRLESEVPSEQPAPEAVARVHLERVSDGATIELFELTGSGSPSPPLTLPVSGSGVLAAGQYRLVVEAWAGHENFLPFALGAVRFGYDVRLGLGTSATTTTTLPTTTTSTTTTTSAATTTTTFGTTTTTMVTPQLCPLTVFEPECVHGDSSSLKISRGAIPEKDEIKWKSSRGGLIDQADLGSPSSTTQYELCIYELALLPVLKAAIPISPAPAWNDRSPKGWIYNDKAGLADGIRKIKIKAGSAGKTKVQVRAKGSTPLWPDPLDAGSFVPAHAFVAIGLATNETPGCWFAFFAPDEIKKNTGTRYQAKNR